jgi:hypothetical protein
MVVLLSVLASRDLETLILGAKVPFILRRTDNPFHFWLVGETYVHGIMHGEAIDML